MSLCYDSGSHIHNVSGIKRSINFIEHIERRRKALMEGQRETKGYVLLKLNICTDSGAVTTNPLRPFDPPRASHIPSNHHRVDEF